MILGLDPAKAAILGPFPSGIMHMRLGRALLGTFGLLLLAGIASAYNSEEHKIVGDWGASMVVLPPSVTLPGRTHFEELSLASHLQYYQFAKYTAVGFTTNDQADYNEDVHKVQDHSYWSEESAFDGFAQIHGNKKIFIPDPVDAWLRERSLVVGAVVSSSGQNEFTFGDLVAIYGDYRRTVYCFEGDCHLTNAPTTELSFLEGYDCFPPLGGCGWRPDPMSMYSYLKTVAAGLWPPYGECGNSTGNTAGDGQYNDAGWWGDEMLRISQTNDWHWSSAAVAWYVGMHRLALMYVDMARTDARYWNHALHYEAHALHSLTDLFAFGHIVTNRDRTSYATMKEHNPDLTGTAEYLWMENALLVGGGDRDGSGQVGLDSSLPAIADVSTEQLDFLPSYTPSNWGLYARQEHDFHEAYNNSGAWVRNLKRDRFQIWGDGLLRNSVATAAIMAEAVRASLQALFDAYPRLSAGATVSQIGAPGDPYFEALKSIPIFVESNPNYTYVRPYVCLPGETNPTGHNFDGQWTRYAVFADQISGAQVVPTDASHCVMDYMDGGDEIPGPVTASPCDTFPEAPAVTPPTTISLSQNRPNPATLTTTIEYALPTESQVRLVIYDARGAKVRTLDEGVRPARVHRVTWDGADDDGRQLPAGAYYYRLDVPGRTESKKLIWVR